MGAEIFEHKSYVDYLNDAYKVTVKNGIYAGFGIGMLFFVMLADYSLGFWYGSICI